MNNGHERTSAYERIDASRRAAGLNDEDEGNAAKERPESVKIALELLKKERTVFISEPVTPKLTERLVTQLLWLDSQSQAPIKLFINTPGGSADDGFAIHDMLKFIRSPVFNICVGLNASAGTIVLLGTPKERRLALPNARIMIHQPSGGARGTSSDVEITAEEIIKLRHRANELIAAECDRSVEQVEKDTDRDKWMSPDEAVEYGLVSRVITRLQDIQ